MQQRKFRVVRRIAAMVLHVVGGLYLFTESTYAWRAVSPEDGRNFKILVLIYTGAPAILCLAVGVWLDPGNRRTALGWTIMISAAAGAVWAFGTFVAGYGGRGLDAPFGLANLIMLATAGYCLRRSGQNQAPANDELRRVFE